MNIHCFYSDLILSLQHLFDTKIFPGIIKGYQFNVGNRSLQLKYDTAFEFPRIIINYQTSKPMNYHPYTWTRTQPNNAKIPVLYGVRKKLTLLLHEELFEFQIQVSINCESQFQAIQLEHMLQNYMIMGKYFHMYKFFSFIEIDRYFLQSEIFDVENEDIINLFSRYDSIKNSTEYCFSVEYEPLIRMDSCDLQLGSTDQRSFQLQLGISMINPVPIYLEIPPAEVGGVSSEKNIIEYDIAVPTEDIPVLNLLFRKRNGKRISFPIIINNTNIDSPIEIEEDFYFEENEDIYSGHISSKIIGKKEHAICKVLIDGEEFKTNCAISFNFEDDTIIADFSGVISGRVSNFAGRVVKLDIYNGEIDGNFRGIFNDKLVNIKLHGEYVVYRSTYILAERDIRDEISINAETVNLIIDKRLTTIPIGTIDESTENTTRLLSVYLRGVEIKEIFILYNNKIYDYIITHQVVCDAAGNFTFPLVIKDGNEVIEADVVGKLNNTTRKIEYTVNWENDIKIVLFKCDIRFKSKVGYGASFIERLNVDFLDTFQPIMTESFVSESRNIMSAEVPHKDPIKTTRTLLKTAILKYESRDEIFTLNEEHSNFSIKIILDEHFNYDEIIKEYKVYWKFFVIQPNIHPTRQPYQDQFSNDVVFKNRDETSKPNILEFTCTREIYDDYFCHFNEINPIIFQIFVYQ